MSLILTYSCGYSCEHNDTIRVTSTNSDALVVTFDGTISPHYLLDNEGLVAVREGVGDSAHQGIY